MKQINQIQNIQNMIEYLIIASDTTDKETPLCEIKFF